MQDNDLKKIEAYLEKYKDIDDNDINSAVKVLTFVKEWNDKKIDDDSLVKDMQICFTNIQLTVLLNESEIDEDIYNLNAYAVYLGAKVATPLVKTQADADFYNTLVADCYYNGYIVEKNYKRAFDIYYKQFIKGNYSNSLLLAEFFANGYYVNQNQDFADRLEQLFKDHNKLTNEFVKLKIDLKRELGSNNK